MARYFIVRAYEDSIEAEMTNMKVQKLLYYAQSLHLAMYDEPLFEEEIQAWRYGPVCPLPIPSQEFLLEMPKDKRQLLEEVWEYFGGYHAYQLSGMTHLEFPWKKARKGLLPEASSTKPILLEDLKALGHQKLDQIERDHPAYQFVMQEILKDACTSESSTRIRKGEVRDWLNSLLD
ncbi:Panacea domain-containing protein [Nostoc sp.]|uniref:Panacea domain-containing protein n=1 Tax=Nostoc sp. TaxID=1180 RepID=UPI002FFA5DEE